MSTETDKTLTHSHLAREIATDAVPSVQLPHPPLVFVSHPVLASFQFSISMRRKSSHRHPSKRFAASLQKHERMLAISAKVSKGSRHFAITGKEIVES